MVATGKRFMLPLEAYHAHAISSSLEASIGGLVATSELTEPNKCLSQPSLGVRWQIPFEIIT